MGNFDTGRGLFFFLLGLVFFLAGSFFSFFILELLHVGFGHTEHNKIAENIVKEDRHADEEERGDERVDKEGEFASN